MRGFVGAAGASLALLIVGSASQAEEVVRRGIATSGQAVVHAVPDEVVVTAGVETFHLLLDRAKQDNDAQSQRVLKAVKDLGVQDGDIKTEGIFVDMEYKQRDDPAKGIEGYHARREYSILLHDAARLEALVDAVLKNGANRLGGLQFRTSKLRVHRDQARRMAVRAAREKAQALAAELGVKAGAPISIQEQAWDGGWGGYGHGYANIAQNAAQTVGSPDAGGEALPSDRIEIRAGVKVTFELTTP